MAVFPLALRHTVWIHGHMAHANANPLPPLEAIDTLPVSRLKQLYEKLLRTKPPRYSSAEFLKGTIAWAMQANSMKTDRGALRRSLLHRARKISVTDTRRLKPGTCLIREWQGDTYEVTVQDRGFLWQGRRYRSLSQIARAITGAHWSGPRFFGLVDGGK